MMAKRLGVFYALHFTSMGIYLPFWPLWLAAQGLEVAEVSIVLSLGVLIKVISSPVLAYWVDRRGDRRKPILFFIFAALASFSWFFVVDGFWPILLVTAVFFGIFSLIMPLLDSLTMLTVHRQGGDYGRIRLWGSLSFIVAALAAGLILQGRPAQATWFLIEASLLVTAIGAFALPDIRTPKAAPGKTSITAVLANRRLISIIVCAALIQGSHGVYYAFGSLHWRSVGHGEGLIGALWGEGVIAEIVLFALGGHWLRKIGAARLMGLAAVAGCLRWTAYGLDSSLPLLLCAQPLHAMTYGAAHLGAMHLIADAVPASHSAKAQSLYGAITMGLSTGLSIFLSGFLYQWFSGRAYLFMAALALLGVFAAMTLRRSDSA